MLRIESDPVLRSPVVVVGLLDRCPSHDAIRENFVRGVAAIPRLRQRISQNASGMRWTDDESFEVEHHLRYARVRPHGGLREVLDLAEPDATAPFDSVRPPWLCTIVEGLTAGRAAFVLKFHHTLTDGVGGVELARSLFDTVDAVDDEPKARPTRPQTTEPRRGLVGQATHLLGSVGRMLAPAGAPLSPLFVGRSLDRRMDAFDVALSDMRAAARSVDVTVNELFLSAVTGGLHDYHARLGADVAALRFTMPISLRTEDDAAGGNQFVPARFVLPIDDPDPAVRAHLAASMVRRWRREPALGLTSLIADGLARLPTQVVTRVFAGLLRNVDADVVDVAGLRHPAFLAGAQVLSMWAFAPPTGAALSITLLSHGPKCCIAILSDRAAVADTGLLLTCFEHAFDEVIALGGHATTKDLSA